MKYTCEYCDTKFESTNYLNNPILCIHCRKDVKKIQKVPSKVVYNKAVTELISASIDLDEILNVS